MRLFLYILCFLSQIICYAQFHSEIVWAQYFTGPLDQDLYDFVEDADGTIYGVAFYGQKTGDFAISDNEYLPFFIIDRNGENKRLIPIEYPVEAGNTVLEIHHRAIEFSQENTLLILVSILLVDKNSITQDLLVCFEVNRLGEILRISDVLAKREDINFIHHLDMKLTTHWIKHEGKFYIFGIAEINKSSPGREYTPCLNVLNYSSLSFEKGIVLDSNSIGEIQSVVQLPNGNFLTSGYVETMAFLPKDLDTLKFMEYGKPRYVYRLQEIDNDGNIIRSEYIFVRNLFSDPEFRLAKLKQDSIAYCFSVYVDTFKQFNNSKTEYLIIHGYLNQDFQIQEKNRIDIKRLYSNINIGSTEDGYCIVGFFYDKNFINMLHVPGELSFFGTFLFLIEPDKQPIYTTLTSNYEFTYNQIRVSKFSNDILLGGSIINKKDKPGIRVDCCYENYEAFIAKIQFKQKALERKQTYACKNTFSVLNNLTNHIVKLDYISTFSSNSIVSLYTVSGQLVDQFKWQTQSEYDTYLYALDFLADGVYVITIDNANLRCSDLVVVHK